MAPQASELDEGEWEFASICGGRKSSEVSTCESLPWLLVDWFWFALLALALVLAVYKARCSSRCIAACGFEDFGGYW